MINPKEVLITGGSGMLGSELKKLVPEANFPSHKDFDVTDYKQMDNFIKSKKYKLFLHAAAFTSPPKVNEDPINGIDINIIGTANIVKLCLKYNLWLIYISTDYVFKGDKGKYKEYDPVFPVNKYAWSKLGGECAVHLYNNSLIIRTSFGPNVFPYEKAFIDQWTSRENVSVIAKKIIDILKNGENITGIIHIGGKRKTVYEYACGLDERKKIGTISVKDVSFIAPRDTSLICDRYNKLLKSKRN